LFYSTSRIIAIYINTENCQICISEEEARGESAENDDWSVLSTVVFPVFVM
jgi:hypothetical protein